MAADLILLTGATGHVGFRTLVDALKAGYRVRAAVRNPASAKVQLIKSNPEIAALSLGPDVLTFTTVPDFLAPSAFDEAVRDVKYVLHIASPIASADASAMTDTDKYFIQPAVKGTLAVLSAAHKAGSVEKIVVTSSVVAVVPAPVFQGLDKTTYTASNRVDVLPGPYDSIFMAYTMSKVAALNQAEAWYREHQPGFDLIHVHPGLVFGSDALVNDVKELTSEGSNMRLFAAATGTGGSVFGCGVHVSDVSRVHVGALQPHIKGLQSLGASINVDWTELPAILNAEFPEAVKSGLLKTDPSLSTGYFDLDSSATEEALGFEFLGFPQQVKDSISHYIKLAGSSSA